MRLGDLRVLFPSDATWLSEITRALRRQAESSGKVVIDAKDMFDLADRLDEISGIPTDRFLSSTASTAPHTSDPLPPTGSNPPDEEF